MKQFLTDTMILNVKERVTSIKHILGREVSFNSIEDSMKLGFEEEFNVSLEEGELTLEELELSKKYEKQYFSADSWNKKR